MDAAADREPPSNETRWERANRIGRESYDVLADDRRLLIFPALSAAVNLAIGGLSFALSDHVVGGRGHGRILILVGALIASYPATFVGVFSGVALAAMLAAKLDGRPVGVGDGWRVARERAGTIAGWTLLTCTIGGILRVLEEYVPLGGRIAALVLDVSWSLATLFAVPVIAYEGLGPRDAVRRSTQLFRERWGEQVAGAIGVNVLGGFLVLPGVLFVVAGAAKGVSGSVLLVAIGGALICAAEAYAIALGQTYRVYLYRSTLAPAQTLPGPYLRDDLERPFRTRKKRWWH